MITCYQFEHGVLHARPLPPDAALPEGVVWIDLLAPTEAEEAFVEKALGLDIPTREELAEIEDSSRFYEAEEALFMTATVVSGIHRQAPTSAQMTFVLTPRCLVTVRYAELTALAQLQARPMRLNGHRGGSEKVFVTLLDALIDRIADVLEVLQVQLNTLSASVFGKDEKARADLQRVLKQLGQQRTLLGQLGESLFSVSRLITYYRQYGGTTFPGAAKGSVKALERDVRSLGEHQSRLLGDIAFLLDATLGLINIEQNAIIKVFSIAAVLFLPPTLVGTVYGMNFHHMPELDWLLGYPMALVLMVVSASIPYAWFKWRGWL